MAPKSAIDRRLARRLELMIEALREGWRERRFTLEALDGMARLCRVRQVMRRYIEALRGISASLYVGD